MRFIIAGGRDFTDYTYMLNTAVPVVKFACFVGHEITILCGCAPGADTMGEIIAKEQGWKVERFPADWQKHGKSAGYKRNLEMAESADRLIAYWDGKSKGTKHMIDIAKERFIPTIIFKY